jgi:sigma-B regulation protein RsbU (phosphoserine phosphatase)
MSVRASSASQPIRVLIVEDDPDDVMMLREDLAAAPVPFEVEVCRTLGEALRRLDRPARGEPVEPDVDVTITDLSLPDSQGLNTFHALAAHPSHVPIIVLSGLMDEALALETVEQGAQDYLVKGQCDQRLLVRSLRYAIKRAEAERALAVERNLLRNVVDNLMDAIYVKDASGRYLLGNLAHARQIGADSPEEVVGKHTTDLFSAATARAFLEDDERVLRGGEAIVNRHERVLEEGRPARWLSTTKVPLRNGEGDIIGLVGIGRDITARKVAEEKLARYTKELKEKNAELEEDLNMAREVQLAFLPQQFPTFPRHAAPDDSSLQFHAEYLPATTLGGDFFHIIPLSDNEAGILICDVMGHGVRAALVTAVHRALVEELTPYAGDPAAFLSRMNHELYVILRRTRSPMFASAFYLTVNTATGELRYANAGHPRPLHIRREIDDVSLLQFDGRRRSGPALGIFENTVYQTVSSTVRTGDVLLLFTDGLYEVEDARGELYDQNLLLETVTRRRELPTRELFQEILQEARAFSASGAFLDDVCLVSVEVCRISGEITHCPGEPQAALQSA